jgi:hypothetical protein
MVRRSRRAFCEVGPRVSRPTGHGLLIALTSPARGFLRTPAQAAQYAPDAGGTRRDAERLVPQGRDPCEGPSLVRIAIRTWALAEQGEQVVPLCQSELGDTARVALRVQPCLTIVVPGITPAADRAGRHVHRAGHVAYAPAFLEEGHGDSTTDCQLLFGACGSHMTLSGITHQFL